MVRKTEEGFTIDIDCGLHPANDYVEITNGIICMLQDQDKEVDGGNYYVLLLLQNMLPTVEQAKVMFDS